MRQNRVENEKERRFSLRNVANGGEMITCVSLRWRSTNATGIVHWTRLNLPVFCKCKCKMQNVKHTVQSIESVHIASPTEAADQWMYGSMRPTLVCLYISSSKCQHINPLFELQKATRCTAFYIRFCVCCVREFELVYYIRSERARARISRKEMAQHTAKALIKPKYAEQE